METNHVIVGFKKFAALVGLGCQRTNPELFKGNFEANHAKHKRYAGEMYASLQKGALAAEVEHLMLILSADEIVISIAACEGPTIESFKTELADFDNRLNDLLIGMSPGRVEALHQYLKGCFEELSEFGLVCVRDVA